MRQPNRRLAFKIAFREITKNYGGELRKVRRKMAKNLGRRIWKEDRKSI